MSRILKIIGAFAIALVVWLLAAPFVAGFLIVHEDVGKTDAILVLSGSRVFRERTAKAAALYKEGRAPIVAVSDDGGEAGWSVVEKRNPKFVDLEITSLVGAGVPKENIVVLDGKVDGTVDEARVFQKTAERKGWKSVTIVTSGYHSRRALKIFGSELKGANIRTGIDPAPAGEATPSVNTWWFSIRGWKFVGGEYVKIAYYLLFY
ncbi:MAG: YdcF family protein [Pyrinomonadaceae bacterium]